MKSEFSKTNKEVKALIESVLKEKGISYEFKTIDKIDGSVEKLMIPVDGTPGLFMGFDYPRVLAAIQKEVDSGLPLDKELVWDVLSDFINQSEVDRPKSFSDVTPEALRERLDTSLKIRLVNAEAHAKRLTGFVCRMVGDLDLAMVCYIDLSDMFAGNNKACVALKKEMLKSWGISEDEVFAKALTRLESEKPKVNSLNEFLFGLPNPNGPLIVSNTDILWGAAFLASDKSMAQISAKYYDGKSFRIIPSSIHELLTLSDSLMDVETVAEMVRDVNHTEVSPEERLSNCVYRFNAETGKVEIEYRANNDNLLSDISFAS